VGITSAIAEFASRTGFADLPSEAVTQAKRAILDTLGVAIAGSVEPCARIAADVVRADAGRPVSTVIGQGFAAPARAAALVNGVAAHALDYDDVNSSMRGHPSPPLLPVLLAAGEETGATGAALIEAFVLGFEVECKIGRGLGMSHYPHGWHATSTLGTLGAAVVAGKLYGLTRDQMVMALGIAVSLAGGSRQNFGTMTKPLHPGAAAQNGVLAAQLARGGFTADHTIVEAPLGFLNLFSPAADARPERVLESLGKPFDIVSPGISVKKYPCCFNTHRPLDATLALRQQHGATAEQVDRVAVTVPRGSVSAVIHHRPETGLEGKFSLEYCVTAALIDGRVVLDTFTDAAVQRPRSQALLRRVETVEVDGASAEAYADVQLFMRDGQVLRRRVNEPRGAPTDPLSWDEIAAKYRDCADRVIGREATEGSIDRIAELDKLPAISDLMRLVAAQPAAAAAV
jgi:2-methylcitrate dehydratase PrpD